jgi:hypothetical protein
MAQNFTYNELLALQTSYTTNTNTAFTDESPTFIALAENRIATEMKQQGFQTPVTGIFDGSPTLAKPAYWRETIAFSYIDESGARQPILLRSYDYCRNYNPSGASGPPKFYADYNFNNFLITPTPDQAYDFELTYYARLTPLSASNQSNWLTMNMPQALVAAMMVEAYIWLKNPAEQAKWEDRYQQSKGGALQENIERVADRNLAVTKG